jgi:uncharacterized cofD-like protein
MKNFRITTIGGGTGTFVILRGLKNYPVELTGVVTVADSGGSTGRLRSEFGFLPVGDLRQSLAALADDEEEILTRLLAYRFDRGEGLAGHNLGNLVLTALRDLYGSEAKALAKAGEVFRISGKILPVSLSQADLGVVYEDGERVIGEHRIDQPHHGGGKRVVKVFLKRRVKAYRGALSAIEEADLLVLGPGDLYTSTLPCLLVDGVRQSLRRSRAKAVYVVNLTNRYSQTHQFKASDYLAEVEKYAGRPVDVAFVNTSKMPKKVQPAYLAEKATLVEDDLEGRRRGLVVVRGDFAHRRRVGKVAGDTIPRSFWRHDEDKLARVLIKILL